MTNDFSCRHGNGQEACKNRYISIDLADRDEDALEFQLFAKAEEDSDDEMCSLDVGD